MALFYGAKHWYTTFQCLDDAFDVPDDAADHELCCAIVAGKGGLHPDAWGNHHSIAGPTLPARKWKDWAPYKRPRVGRKAQDEWEAKPWRPWKRKPKPRRPNHRPWLRQRVVPSAWPPPGWVPPPPPPPTRAGEIELTCDNCSRRFAMTLHYAVGERPIKATLLRGLGAMDGWTHVDGRDRCPMCSPIPAPKQEGNGAGEHQNDEQHTQRG